jgi:hypothetical protein
LKKIAILIGNDNYDDSSRILTCAVNDAESLCETLEKLQFDVCLYKDVNGRDISEAMTNYSRKLQDYEVGLFFFAGHGFQIEGNNYLGCTDTSFVDATSMKHTAYPLQSVLDDLQNSTLQVKILIIDACRSFAGTRGGNDGFAPVFAPKGTIIAFATSPGQTAKEKDGHGIFTKALLQHINTRNISIEEMFKRVRNSVYLESSGSQVTWEHTSLMGKFAFNDYVAVEVASRYSRIALADGKYEPESNGRCYELIQDAKTYNYNYQNTIPTNMSKWLEDMYHESPDDIFVLGRNLYQAAENAFSISDYFNQLAANLSGYDKNFANHLLTGMAYEIYFGSDGKLRNRFKTNRYYIDVLVLIMSGSYCESKDFLVSQLKEYPQKIMYIPGEKLKATVELIQRKQRHTDKDIYVVNQIFVDGINVIYNEDGTEPYDAVDDYRSYAEPEGLEPMSASLMSAMAGTRRGVEIEYVMRDGTQVDSSVDVLIPMRYSLLRYSN